MNIVMKRPKCKACGERFVPPSRGRRPRYCSAACRQKAYRKRAANPHHHMLKALSSDLYAIRDLSARARAACKVLEEQGYEVGLRRRSGPPPKKRKPFLRVVDSLNGEDD